MRKAASTLTSFLFAFGIVVSGGSSASANVVAGNGYSASYSGESSFLGLAPGATGQLSAVFFNDGSQAWVPGVVGLLVCLPDKVTCNLASPNAAYAVNWYSTTVYATVTALVAPGSNGFFIYNIKVPDSALPATTATFNGDVGLITVGAVLRPQGYFQQNATPLPVRPLTITPVSVAVSVGQSLQFTSSIAAAWTVTGGCGAITTSGLFAATATNSSSQPCAVVATSAGMTAQAAVTVFGPPASISCSSDNASIVADGASTTTVRATLRDANGNAVGNAVTPPITFTNITPTLVTMFPTGTQNPTAGVASVTLTSTLAPGSAQLTATSAGLTGCNVTVTTGVAGAASQTFASFLTDPVAADGVSTSVLRVDLRDAQGVRATNDSTTQVIATRVTTSSGVCAIGGIGAVASAAIQGRVDFVVTTTTLPGTCRFTVTTNNSSITGTQATMTTQLVGAASKLAVTGTDSPKTAGSTAGLTVTVDIQDAVGRRVTGSSALVTLQLDAASCTGAAPGTVYAPGGTAMTALQGRVTFQLSSFGAYPGCVVTLNSASLTGTNTTVRFDPGGADHLTCVFLPTAIVGNGSSLATATVQVRDARENPVTAGGPYSVTFVRATGGVTTIVTSSVLNTSNGAVTFTVRSNASGTFGVDSYNAQITAGSQPSLPNPTTLSACSVSVTP